MAVTVRQARLEDRATLVELHRALYVEHRGEVMPAELEPLYAYRRFDEVLAEDVAAMLRNPATTLLVAEDEEERAVGYVSGYVQHDPRRLLSRKGVLGDWYVRQEHRGAGVGRQLLDALFAIFADAGCSVVETSTWPFNTATRRAMEHLGFREIQIVYRREL